MLWVSSAAAFLSYSSLKMHQFRWSSHIQTGCMLFLIPDTQQHVEVVLAPLSNNDSVIYGFLQWTEAGTCQQYGNEFHGQPSAEQTHTRPCDHPSPDPSDTNKYHFYLFSWHLYLFNFMHQWWVNEWINYVHGITADTIKKRIGGFAMVIEESTLAHNDTFYNLSCCD